VFPTHQWQGIGSKSIEKPICLPKRILLVVAGVLPTVPRFLTSDAVGVGKPPKPRPDVWSADAASWQIRRRCGVACALQVSANMVEPSEAIPSCNLFAKDCWRAQLADEAEERRPKMPVVFVGFAFSCHAERLAGAATRPGRLVVWHPCEPQGSTPSTDTGEEVALGISSEVVGLNKSNVPFIDITWRYVPSSDEIAEPLRSVGVDLVVIGTAHRPSLCMSPS
jgi:hypothetical protein